LNKAIEYYILSADKGNSFAQNTLGFLYEKGLGVEKDLKKSIEYFTLSADQGDSDAQHNLDVFGIKI